MPPRGLNSRTMGNDRVFIDAHCHLADARFDGQRADVIARAVAVGVTHFVQGGVDPNDWNRQEAFADDRWLCAFGVHPWIVRTSNRKDVRDAVAALPARLSRAAAIGELGLDYTCTETPADRQFQRDILKQQLEIAHQVDKPVVLHVVGAHADAIGILRSAGLPIRGLVHGFTASLELAQCYLNLGLMISIGCGVLRPGFKKLKRALPHLPLESIVVESDAPNSSEMGPTETTEPRIIRRVAARVADALGTTAERVLTQSTANLIATFSLEPHQ